MRIYLPAGYTVDLSRPVGSRIGHVSAIVVSGDGTFSGGMSGAVTVADPASPAPGRACAPGPHAAVWDATYLGGPTVRLYVDPTAGVESALGAFKLIACFDSPYATDTPRALEYEISLSSGARPVVTPPARGSYLWRMFVTRFVDGTARPDPASTFEARTRVLEPHVLTVWASYRVNGQKLVVSGRLSALGRPRRGVYVTVVRVARSGNRALLGRVRTRSDGRYTSSARLR